MVGRVAVGDKVAGWRQLHSYGFDDTDLLRVRLRPMAFRSFKYHFLFFIFILFLRTFLIRHRKRPLLAWVQRCISGRSKGHFQIISFLDIFPHFYNLVITKKNHFVLPIVLVYYLRWSCYIYKNIK